MQDATEKEAAEHFGYDKLANSVGLWKNEPGVLQRLELLPQVLDPEKKVRVTFDYDPHFPRALLQVTTYD